MLFSPVLPAGVNTTRQRFSPALPGGNSPAPYDGAALNPLEGRPVSFAGPIIFQRGQ
jgi:hypothetical protein